MNKNLLVMYQFIKRDIRVYKGRIIKLLIDYATINPLLFALSFGYILPAVGGLGEGRGSLILFSGMFLWNMFSVGFTLTYDLFEDLCGNRFVSYQALMVPPKILVLEKVVFYSLICFLCVIPLVPLSLTVLGYISLLAQISWLRLFVILYLASLFVSVYYVLAMVTLSGPEKMVIFWRRFTYPLAVLGGETIPRYVVAKFSPMLGKVVLFNPFIYITEGLRGEIIGGGKYLTFKACCLGLIIFSILFTLLAFQQFRKRIDHV